MSNPLPFYSAENGVDVGSFAWVNTDTGRVENVRYSPHHLLGFVMPLANLVAIPRTWGIIPPGYEITLAIKGDFFAVFPDGAVRGQPVYASIFDGTPISGETPDAQATPWYVMTDASPGGLAIISTWR